MRIVVVAGSDVYVESASTSLVELQNYEGQRKNIPENRSMFAIRLALEQRIAVRLCLLSIRAV